MRLNPFARRAAPVAETRQASIENPIVPVSSDNFLAFFGLGSVNLPRVTTVAALSVPAVAAAVTFLSRTLAALPLDAKRRVGDDESPIGGNIQTLVHDYPNDDMDGFKFRQYFWQQVFTGGRGLAWIERKGAVPVALWPMDPARVTIAREQQKLVYRWENQTYAASEVIDVPFMLRSDMVLHYGPIALAGKAIQLAIAMNDYGSNFFAGGGVPPLSLEGPLPVGPDGVKRAQEDIKRAINAAKGNGEPVFPIPSGYKLNPVGFDPAKGQMLEARLFQVQEIARGWQIPPNFLQDLSKATFANVEQNDLYLVKHLISQWAKALEGEMSLKLFGRGSNRYVEHDLDGLMRGDFLSRMDGFAKAINSGQITPNEARAENSRSKHKNPAADDLFIQGATLPLGTVASKPATPTPPAPEPSSNPENVDNGDGNDNQA